MGIIFHTTYNGNVFADMKASSGADTQAFSQSNDVFFDNRKTTVYRFPVTYTAGRRKKTEEGCEAKKATEILCISK